MQTSVKYTEYRFRKLSSARSKARQMKKKYGYTPSVFKYTNRRTKRVAYVVVKPHGIKALR